MRQDLIEKLRNGEIAVRNDGTWHDLNNVLTNAFKHGKYSSLYTWECYGKLDSSFFGYDEVTAKGQGMGIISVNDFFEEEFVNGDKVYFKYMDEWREAIYIGINPNAKELPFPSHVVITNDRMVNELVFATEIRHKKPSKTVKEEASEIKDQLNALIERL